MKLRFSIAHFSVKHRKPFKNSFCPSRRHRRQTASRCLANFLFSLPQTLKKSLWPSHFFCSTANLRCATSTSDSPPLWRTAAVVRNRRDIANHHDVQSGGGQRAHRGLAAGARALHAYFHALHPVLVARDARGRQRSLLRGVRRALARALEADGARGRPTHHAAIRVRDGDLRVVERRRDMHVAVRNHATLALFLELFLALGRRCRLSRRSGIRRCSCGLWFFWHVSLHSFDARSQNRLALLADRLLLRCHGAAPRTLAGARVGVRTLAAHRQIPAVANTAIGLNFNQPANVHLNLLAEIAFHAAFLLDGLADVVDFFFGQVADFFRVVHAGFGGQLFRALPPDAVDGGQANPKPFLNRKINACYACHETCLLKVPPRNSIYPSLCFLLVAVDDAAARQIVRRKLHGYFVSRENTNKILAHLAGNVRQHLMLVFQLHAKHGVRQRLDHRGHYFNGVLLGIAGVAFLFLVAKLLRHSLLCCPLYWPG